MTTQQLYNEVSAELERIAAFWGSLRDGRGGFYGGVDDTLTIDKEADKGCILNSRILWFFSNFYLICKEEQALAHAQHAYDFLRDHCIDKQYGGVYWLLHADGTPADTQKYCYSNAFAIYALSAYYSITRDSDVMGLAMTLYHTMEQRWKDGYGYIEAFDRTWNRTEHSVLSEDGYDAKKTMNTLLHIIEAYTELYRVSRDKEVGKSLAAALRLCLDKVYDRKERMLRVFFDERMQSIADIYSYGHDIEATWLLDRACEVLGDPALAAEITQMNRILAAHVLEEAFDGKALGNQRLRGEADPLRIWWVQAEGVVGFLNAYQRTGDKTYKDTALSLWSYIKAHIIDRRAGGEWYWCVDGSGKPVAGFPIVEPWKCPYHNGRMCMEVMKRCAEL